MSDRQIATYLSRIPVDDDNRDLFVRVIVPLLRKCAQETSNMASAGTACPFCDTGSSRNFLGKDKTTTTTTVKCTSYYALVRHLSTKHRDLLPCNGYVLSDSEPLKYKCVPCDQQFSRKDHYNTHLKSHKHLKSTASNQQMEKQKEERYKQQCLARKCNVVLKKLPFVSPQSSSDIPHNDDKTLGSLPNPIGEVDKEATQEDKFITFEEAINLIDDFDFSDEEQSQTNAGEDDIEERELDSHLTFASGQDELDWSELYENSIFCSATASQSKSKDSSNNTRSDSPIICDDSRTEVDDHLSDETLPIREEITQQDIDCLQEIELTDCGQVDSDDDQDDYDLVQALCSFELARSRRLNEHKRNNKELWNTDDDDDDDTNFDGGRKKLKKEERDMD